jgi:hypothetical protein
MTVGFIGARGGTDGGVEAFGGAAGGFGAAGGWRTARMGGGVVTVVAGGAAG